MTESASVRFSYFLESIVAVLRIRFEKKKKKSQYLVPAARESPYFIRRSIVWSVDAMLAKCCSAELFVSARCLRVTQVSSEKRGGLSPTIAGGTNV